MEINPYQSPSVAADSKATPSEKQAFSASSASSAMWALAFALNLPVPLMLAGVVARESAWLGVGIALVVLLALGWTAARIAPDAMAMLAGGGFLTSLTQLVPIAQIFVGAVVIGFCNDLGLTSQTNDPIESLHGPVGGFVATILTSIPFLGLALFCGFAISKLSGGTKS